MGDIIVKDMDVMGTGDAGGIGVGFLLELELKWEMGNISEAAELGGV
jgi:hypothetical protein